MAFHVPEEFRIHQGPMGTTKADGNNGVFNYQYCGYSLRIVASDGMGWEHVSVSLPTRCPTWEEMCRVKNMFWDDTDCVVQYHPPKSDYVNNHPYCLHLWRPIGIELPKPPSFMVGHAGMSAADAKKLAEGLK